MMPKSRVSLLAVTVFFCGIDFFFPLLRPAKASSEDSVSPSASNGSPRASDTSTTPSFSRVPGVAVETLPGLLDLRGRPSEVCTQNLRDAINAAISEVIGSGELTEHLLPLWREVPFIPVLRCAPSPTPGFSSLPWPLPASVWRHEDDLLQQILTRGTVRVAFVGRVVSSDKRVVASPTNAGDSIGVYSQSSPFGFFPDYIRAVWRIIALRYAVVISVLFMAFDTVEDAQAAVVAGTADMTNLDFLLSHRGAGGSNPQHALYASCPSVGLPLTAVVREGETDSPGDLVKSIKKAVEYNGDVGESTVTVPSEEFVSAVYSVVPRTATVKVVSRKEEAFALLTSRKAKVVFVDGLATQHAALPKGLVFLRIVSLVLAAGTWIRRSQSVKCLNREHRVSLLHAAEAAEREE